MLKTLLGKIVLLHRATTKRYMIIKTTLYDIHYKSRRYIIINALLSNTNTFNKECKRYLGGRRYPFMRVGLVLGLIVFIALTAQPKATASYNHAQHTTLHNSSSVIFIILVSSSSVSWDW